MISENIQKLRKRSKLSQEELADIVGNNLPMTAIYSIELISAFVVSVVLYEIIRRIPVLKYWILGIRKKKRT